jgi:hypothetical protein
MATKLNLKWEAPEFKHHPKSIQWYTLFAIITIGLITYGIYIHDWLTSTTFFVLAMALLVFTTQRPTKVTHELTATGIRVKSTFFPYKNIRKLWIIYTKENKTLNLETTAYVNNQITLQLGKENPLTIREYLKSYLSEDLNQEETLTDIISRKIKF